MLTVKNYFQRIKKVDVHALPKDLRDGHQFTKAALNSGRSYKAYKEKASVRERIETYLRRLNLYLDRTPQADTPKPKHFVESLPEEFRIFKRFLKMRNKVRTPNQILNLILTIQRAVTDRKIVDGSPYKKEIRFIEKHLIDFYHTIRGEKKMTIDEKDVVRIKRLLGEKSVFPIVGFIKRFIALQGRPNARQTAINLHESIKAAVESGKIKPSDKYYTKLQTLTRYLFDFISLRQSVLFMEPAQLSGLESVVYEQDEEPHEQVKKKDPAPVNSTGALAGLSYGGRSPQLMNSMDFMNLRFPRLGFKGEWREFIGDPSAGFYMVVYAAPKMGKSLLCILFAGYLARNHGNVIYIAREEGLDATLQDKFKETEQQHPNITLSSYLPDDLAPYDFIFLDSVNRLDLEPAAIDLLRRENPGKSFISVFQVTKEGKLRGSNEHAHDADIIVNFTEAGKATQSGRFNQGGEMTLTQIQDK